MVMANAPTKSLMSQASLFCDDIMNHCLLRVSAKKRGVFPIFLQAVPIINDKCFEPLHRTNIPRQSHFQVKLTHLLSTEQ